jgi:riboflavin transporter FmnP
MALAFYIWKRPITNDKADLFPNAARIIWIVLIIQNVLAQLVTGPPTVWNEVIFNIYYVVLFLISAVIVHHHAEAVRNRFSAAHEFS